MTARANAVSRVLSRGGHVRSVSHRTRIPSVYAYTPGFHATLYAAGIVLVEHICEAKNWPRSRDEEADRLAAYTDTLTAAGYTVTRAPFGLHVTLQEVPA